MSGSNKRTIIDMTGKAVSWCDVILIGPGIGMGRSAAKLVSKVMLDTDKPVLVDADAIRICSTDEQIKNCLRCGTHSGIVMTPHPGEFSCMSGKTVMEIKDSFATLPLYYVKDMHVTLVCKDARSMIVSYGCREAYVNTTGNDGMAVAGSGDVLSQRGRASSSKRLVIIVTSSLAEQTQGIS